MFAILLASFVFGLVSDVMFVGYLAQCVQADSVDETSFFRASELILYCSLASTILAHVIFSTKYWSLSQRMELLCLQKNPDSQHQKSVIVCAVQAVSLLVCVAMNSWAMMRPERRKDIMVCAAALTALVLGF